MAKYEVSDSMFEIVEFLPDGTAEVHKRSILSHTMHKTVLAITMEQIHAWQIQRKLIQDVFPHLSSEEREFLMTGATPEEWDNEFKDEDEGKQDVS
jgi:hypothetical protein